MPCDICGKETRVQFTNIEGARLYVCRDCNPTGEGIIERKRQDFRKVNRPFRKPMSLLEKKKIDDEKKSTFTQRKPQRNYRKFKQFDSDLKLVENYNQVFRKAREDKNLSMEDLAKKMRESESFLHKIEQGKLKPNDRVLLKIYDFLGVTLVKGEEDEEAKTANVKQPEKEIKREEPFTVITVNNKRKIVF